jgi:hypothetical protein
MLRGVFGVTSSQVHESVKLSLLMYEINSYEVKVTSSGIMYTSKQTILTECQLLWIDSVAWSAQQITTAAFSAF